MTDYEENPEELLGIESEIQEDQELEGLGRRFNFNAAQRSAIRTYGRKRATRAYRRRGVTKGQSLLVAKAKKNFTADTVKGLKTGVIKFRDGIHYVRVDITGAGGVHEVFTDSLDKVTGITSISKGKLPEGENMMVRRFELNYDSADAITEKTADLAPLTAGDDNALFNGEIEVRIGQRSVFRQPVNRFLQPDKKIVGSPANGVNLDAPILIKEKEDIQVLFHFAGTMTVVATNKEIAEIVFVGDATSKKA